MPLGHVEARQNSASGSEAAPGAATGAATGRSNTEEVEPASVESPLATDAIASMSTSTSAGSPAATAATAAQAAPSFASVLEVVDARPVVGSDGPNERTALGFPLLAAVAIAARSGSESGSSAPTLPTTAATSSDLPILQLPGSPSDSGKFIHAAERFQPLAEQTK
ncbi:hypothetical protein MKZ38_001940 [Zalerion maritima]|uniref:Uncharacterized protein n=1 Tax=Zalerion maritima TaxID=339359 RepID=A0AAD5WST6_9PEZI|nr:hypothetical protein MKZ38_001940 [Zalerion maritima]